MWKEGICEEEEEEGGEGGREGGVMMGEEEDVLGLGLVLKEGKVQEGGEGGREDEVEEEGFLLFPCGVGTHPEQENLLVAPTAAAAAEGKEGGMEGGGGGGGGAAAAAGGESLPLSPVPHAQVNSQLLPTYPRRRPSSSLPSSSSSSLPSSTFSVTPARDDFFSVAVKQEEGEERREEGEGEEGEVISAGTSAATTMEGGEGWGEGGGEEGVMLEFGLDMTAAEFQALLSEVEEGGEDGREEGSSSLGLRGGEEEEEGGREGGREGCGYVDESFYFAYPGPQATMAGEGGEAVPSLSQVSTSVVEGEEDGLF